MSQPNSSSDKDDKNMRPAVPPGSVPPRVSGPLPGPPMPPHSYRHHPHGPPTHPHQHMMFMPMAPPGNRRDGVHPASSVTGSMPRPPQQHLGRPSHNGGGHPSHPQSHAPHPYYSNHRGAPPHHPFMMSIPMQHHHQQPSHHGHGRPTHQMQPPKNGNVPNGVNGKILKGGRPNIKNGNQLSASMGKTRQPYVKKASGVKWTTDEVSFDRKEKERNKISINFERSQ
jgi:hypothetical protein